MARSSTKRHKRRKKRSAGLLVVSGRRVLVLERSQRTRNGGLWGLPGGRLERGEAPHDGARREAVEELRRLPPLELLGRFSVRRARAGRYEIFVCRAPSGIRARWRPKLNGEHTEWRWVRLEWLLAEHKRLHPVLRTLFDKPDGLRALSRVLNERHASIEGVPPRRRDQTLIIEGRTEAA